MNNHGKLPLGFVYSGEIVYPDGRVEQVPLTHNLIPQTGIDYFVGSSLRGTKTPISSWYLFLFENNYVPDGTETSAVLQSAIGETQAYDEATRPAWTHAYDGTSVVDNLASRGVFTFNADKTIYGAGIVSVSGKGGNSGQLLSVARFPSPRQPSAGAEFRLAAGITIIPATVI